MKWMAAEFGKTVKFTDGAYASFEAAIGQGWSSRVVPEKVAALIEQLAPGTKPVRAKADRIRQLFDLVRAAA